MAVSSDLLTVVVGLCDGNIVVISGHPKKLKILRQKEQTVQTGNPITGFEKK